MASRKGVRQSMAFGLCGYVAYYLCQWFIVRTITTVTQLCSEATSHLTVDIFSCYMRLILNHAVLLVNLATASFDHFSYYFLH